MSTTQKRGFRLPWSSDPEPEQGDEDTQRLGELLVSVSGSGKAPASAGPRELGEGPFHATPVESVDGVNQAAAAGESEAVVLESVVDQRAGEPEEMEVTSSQELDTQPEGTAWPAADHRDAPTPQQTEEPAQVEEPAQSAVPAATPRRDNPLVAGLVKAMREAAEASRDETIAALQAEATDQVEAIRSGATEDAEALRKRADDDIDEIRDWTKAEVARIKEESEQRVAERRETLERELEEHAQDVDAQAAQVEDAVAGYELEMESFFEQLLGETDPARLAALAERAPAPPILSELPAVRRASARHRDDAAEPEAATEPADDAPMAEVTDMAGVAEASEMADDAAMAQMGDTAESSDEAEAAELAEAHVEDTESSAVVPAGEAQVHEPLDDEAAATAEAEALGELGASDSADAAAMTSGDVEADEAHAAERPAASDPGRQRVIVTGLATVAGISAFKSALGQVQGVQTVSVMAGDPGSFVFTVAHEPDLDLPAALTGMSSFEAQITSDDGDTVHVSAREPAA